MFKSLSPGAIGISASFEEGLKLAAAAGFDALDLPIGYLADLADQHSIGHVKRLFADAGVRPGGWGLPVNYRGAGEDFQKGLDGLPRLVRAAAELGSPWCATWILPFSETLDYQANFDFHARRLARCARILRDHDCRLGLEFIGPWTMRREKKHPFVFDMPGMLKLADAIGTGNVGLLLDCWHWYTSFGTIGEILRLEGRQIVVVHVNDAPAGIPADEQVDSVRALPATTGVIDIRGFLKALGLIGFDGPVVVEPFNQALNAVAKETPLQAARMASEALGRAWASAGLTG
ncbi:MAG: sugar phosphate isomerase/epimerase [Planctomycetes bacterium]|nr:sugar phosphate isomerase/epimerase [Planctomycetota bacterium]